MILPYLPLSLGPSTAATCPSLAGAGAGSARPSSHQATSPGAVLCGHRTLGHSPVHPAGVEGSPQRSTDWYVSENNWL